MTTIIKKSEDLQIDDIIIVSNKPIRVVGKWGLAFSLDMYVTDSVKCTSYTANRKMNLKAGQEFNVLIGEESKKSLFEITHLLNQK